VQRLNISVVGLGRARLRLNAPGATRGHQALTVSSGSRPQSPLVGVVVAEDGDRVTQSGPHGRSSIPRSEPPPLSVCIATYNGERYVAGQINTILSDISSDDEVIVVDDASSDDTVAIIEAFRDPRVHIYINSTNEGHVKAFERAIALASGRYVCLADQDDLWPPGRTAKVISALRKYDVVAGEFTAFNVNGTASSSTLRARDSSHTVRNIVGLALGRREYFGCAMAFRSEMQRYLLPIPWYVEAHDHWLALSGNICGVLGHIEDTLVLRRIHDNNLTRPQRRDLLPVIRTRLIWALSVTQLLCRRVLSRT